jgi:hypothetical protein
MLNYNRIPNPSHNTEYTALGIRFSPKLPSLHSGNFGYLRTVMRHKPIEKEYGRTSMCDTRICSGPELKIKSPSFSRVYLSVSEL